MTNHNDDSVYRNSNEALHSMVEALTIENNELRSELERLQSLFDADNKAIVFCPIDPDYYQQQHTKPKTDLLPVISVIFQFCVIVFAFGIADPKYYFLLSLAAIISIFIMVLRHIYKEGS